MRFKNILHYFILGIFLITCAEPPRKTNALVKTSTVPNANHTEPSKIEAKESELLEKNTRVLLFGWIVRNER